MEQQPASSPIIHWLFSVAALSLAVALLCLFNTVHLYAQTSVNIRVILQGPYLGSTPDSMTTALQLQDFLPTTDPYGTGIQATVLPDNIVDWILLEFRTAPAAPAAFRRAALLRRDGIIVDIDGAPPVIDETLLPHGTWYIVLRHRNHLAVMSAFPLVLSAETPLYDMTTGNEKVYLLNGIDYGGLVQVAPSLWAVPAGDVDSNGIIDVRDREKVKANRGFIGYELTDMSMDGITDAGDHVLARNNNRRYSSVSDIPPTTNNALSPIRLVALAPIPLQAGDSWNIELTLDRPAVVRLTLMDINGRGTVVYDGQLYTGCHSLDISSQVLASGSYYLLFEAEGYREIRHIIVAH